MSDNPWGIVITINAQSQMGLREAVAALAPLALANPLPIPTPAPLPAPGVYGHTAQPMTVEQVAALAGTEVASVVEATPAVAAAVRERGKPAPGRARRTKAEIEEDEAAERAEREAAERVEQAEAAGQEADPKDVAVVEGIGSKFAEEVQASAEDEEAAKVDAILNKPKVETATEDTYWYDGEGDEIFIVKAGDPLPAGEAYTEMTKRQYDKAVADAQAKAAAAQVQQAAAQAAPATAQATGKALDKSDVLAALDDVMKAVPASNQDLRLQASARATKVLRDYAMKPAEVPVEKIPELIGRLQKLAEKLKAEHKGA